jgi:hypothetical protein
MVYWVSNPFYAGECADVGYDPLSAVAMRRFYNAASMRVTAELKEIRSRLAAGGHDELLAQYSKMSRADVLKTVRREAKTVNRMLTIEWNASKALGAFAKAVTEPEAKDPLKQFAAAAEELGTELRSMLRRFPVAGMHHDLALLVVVEATAALRKALGFEVAEKSSEVAALIG